MPAGNVNFVERLNRLNEIKRLLDQGKTNHEIAKETGLPIETVRRNIKYLDDLMSSDLTPEQIAEKRSELYLELIEASNEARQLFDKYKTQGKSVDAKRFFDAWLETIQLRAKLYGLDNVKVDAFTQVNTQINISEPERIDPEIGKKIADAIILEHEKRVRENV